MEIHNTTEDIVVKIVNTIFDGITKGGNSDNFCLCYQCKMDTICFTLNRVEPHYIVSNRGLSRIEHTSVRQQQVEADISTLVYKGLRLVNHNMRPTSPHNGSIVNVSKSNSPVFDIPTISGRIFNGRSFEPVTGIDVGLYLEGELIVMRNSNWQNPFTIIKSTPGVFSFWAAPIVAEAADIEKEFLFAIKVKSPDYEPMQHFFNIKSTSKFHSPNSYSLNRAFKLPDLYVFPPGGDEDISK